MDPYYDKIEDYLNGELDDAARRDFEAALQGDAALQTAVARQREVIERLQAMRLRQKIKANMVRPVSGDVWPLGLYNRLLIVFAALVLLSATLYFWFRHPEKGIPANSAPDGQTPAPQDIRTLEEKTPVAEGPAPVSPQNPPKKQSTSDIEPLAADTAVRAACAEIINRLERLDLNVMGDAQKDTSLENKLNDAVFFLKSEKPANAIPLLDSVLAADNAVYQEYAQWLQALAWLLRDPVQGKIYLGVIAADPAHPYRADALRLKRRLH